MSGIDQHPRGARFDDITHSCPECPTPLPGLVGVGLLVPPNPLCPHCRGTGRLTTAELAVWQAQQNARL
jgi:hypothetical protein